MRHHRIPFRLLAATLLAGLTLAGGAAADDVTRIHLEEHNGYFAAEETLADLEAGEYEFIVTNHAGKTVGFQLQNYETQETLAMFPLEPGATDSARVTITEDGFRYRCPINPTPWYELENVSAAD